MAIQLGPFAALWSREGVWVPGHLALLSLASADREVAILRVAMASAGADAALLAMLAERNWRPQIVAASAIALGPADGRWATALFGALDRGSWGSPQIAAALSLHDPDFVRSASARVRRGCPRSGDGWAMGARGTPDGKATGALRALLDPPPELDAGVVPDSADVREGAAEAVRFRDALRRHGAVAAQ